MLRNGIISLLDQIFPYANKLFRDESRNSKEYVKWLGFMAHFWFWHKKCVATLSLHSFTYRFQNVYTGAEAAIFLRVYCVKVKEYLNSQEAA